LQSEPQRHIRKTQQTVRAKLDQLPQRVLGFAALPLLTNELDARLSKADPAEHAADVPVGFPHRPERLESSTVHESEVADINRDFGIGQPAEKAVEQRRAHLATSGLTLAGFPHRVDDVEPLAPSLNHRENNLGRVLEIAVHYDHRITGSRVEPGCDRDLVPKVTR
jgi:hypothetical protein